MPVMTRWRNLGLKEHEVGKDLICFKSTDCKGACPLLWVRVSSRLWVWRHEIEQRFSLEPGPTMHPEPVTDHVH